jgi:nitrogen regulatory protein PII
MAHATRKLITIITEAQIERDLTRDLETQGVLGYTITDARGRGAHGERSSSWSLSGNIRIEVICEAAHADELMTYLRDRYYQNYAMVVFAHDVEVMRPDKFR